MPSGRLTKEKQAEFDAAHAEMEKNWAPPRTDNKGRALVEVVHLHKPLPFQVQGSPQVISYNAPGVEFIGIDYGRREIVFKFTKHGYWRLPLEGNVGPYKARPWSAATPPARDP